MIFSQQKAILNWWGKIKLPLRIYWILGIGWLLFISLAMLTPGERIPEVNIFDFQDKIVHLACFFFLSYLWMGIASQRNPAGSLQVNWKLVIPVTLIPAVILEFAQLWIRNRSFDEFDLLFNCLGILLGIFGYFKISSLLNH